MPKTKRTGFYYYMALNQDRVSKEQGRRIPMSEMPSYVHMEYKQLSDKEKRKYEAMRDDDPHEEKRDHRGIPFSQIKQAQDAAKEKIQNMRCDILQTIEMLKPSNGFHKMNFYIISTSRYVLTAEGSYVPAEIGLCKFSFEKGIIKEFNRILPVQIPSGYRLEANEHSNETHGLMKAEENVWASPSGVPSEIQKFIEESGSSLPPLYCRESIREQTESIMNLIIGKRFKDPLKIYSLDYLFSIIYGSLHNKNIPESIAEDLLDSCSFDYNSELPCKWHNTYDPDSGKHCTLGSSKRYVYIMCDSINVKEKFGIEPIPGKHLPLEGKRIDGISPEDFAPRKPAYQPTFMNASDCEFQLGFTPDSSSGYNEEFPSLGQPRVAKNPGQSAKKTHKLTGGVGRGARLRKDDK